MERVIQVARETGHLDETQEFLPADAFARLPREKVVALCTGSQGESRAALARIAQGDHPIVTLSRGDTVIFSSRTIPGNDKAVGAAINGLVTQGVEVITDRDRAVHASGHPRRDELRAMFSWVRPKVFVPVHGEALHLAKHAELARSLGVPEIVTCRDGDLVHLAPGRPGIVDELPHGRLYKDGRLIEEETAKAVVERRRLAYAGCVFVALALGAKGELADDPVLELIGIPEKDSRGADLAGRVSDVVTETFDTLPKARRRDPDAVAEAVRRAVRAFVAAEWGKKPLCAVHVLEV